ncbi:HIT family protein [Pseudomonas segetis]|uniref:Diadenosine tetraphosphate (Ap4A) hydrolase n=1 Tax=Pseudomonas segetis TaxID=298908 RepID=A0A238ZNP2_9PSED|nr:HIT domain-containing protein [Pseudomonas segetis]SNR84772.1 Diadenosine tetraphosphate (Ap4A) hydrolase [Pseudomonas segetis]
MFALDSRLQSDTRVVGDFPLCRLLLMNDANYPWFILVPRREAVTEVFDLDAADQLLLWQETSQLAAFLKQEFAADKMNIATLGNMVAQLHMHVVARRATDAAWPAPVWGKAPVQAYTEAEIADLRRRLGAANFAGFSAGE